MTWGRQDDYYNSLKHRERSTHGDTVPLTDMLLADMKFLQEKMNTNG